VRRIGIDVGGTNTDAVLVEDTRVLASVKTPTTDDVTGGVRESLRLLVEGELGGDAGLVDAVMIGTTHFTNAIVQRRDVEPVAAIESTNDAPLVVLPLLHGPMGEDGTVQGLLDLADVPYVGSGVLGSALCMDKAMAKRVAASFGIAQAAWQAIHADEVDTDAARRIRAELGDVVFVKPANMGSSVGVSRTASEAELLDALTHASAFDEKKSKSKS